MFFSQACLSDYEHHKVQQHFCVLHLYICLPRPPSNQVCRCVIAVEMQRYFQQPSDALPELFISIAPSGYSSTLDTIVCFHTSSFDICDSGIPWQVVHSEDPSSWSVVS